MLCLLESKGPDITACMIPSSPILLYLFRGVRAEKKERKTCWSTGYTALLAN